MQVDQQAASHGHESWPGRLFWLVIGTAVAVAVTAAITYFSGTVRERIGGDSTYFGARPGCQAGEPEQWAVVKSVLSCSESRSILQKTNDWHGWIAADNGELQFRLVDRPFPAAYQASVSVSRLSDTDPTSQGACAGLSVHTNTAGTTFEELAVCTNGKVSLIKVRDGYEIYRDERMVYSSGVFNLRADVTADTTTFTVDNDQGVTTTLTSTAVLQTTSYIGLTIFWKSASATAGFSSFRYHGEDPA